MAVESPRSGPAGPEETLADVLAAGPLPLAAGLRYAHEIATELCKLHRQTRAYGKLTASSIIVSEYSARLQPLRNYWDQSAQDIDVRAFGVVFLQMLTGTTGPSRVQTAAMNLAQRCFALNGTRPSMQQVAMEIRRLGVLLGEYAGSTPPAEEPAPWTAPSIAAQPEVAEKNLSPAEVGAVPVVPLGRDFFGRPTPKAEAEPQPAGGHCPKCDSSAVYVSRARSRFELLLDRWGVPICRCHRCYHRYVVFAGLKISKDMPAGTERKFRPRRRHD